MSGGIRTGQRTLSSVRTRQMSKPSEQPPDRAPPGRRSDHGIGVRPVLPRRASVPSAWTRSCSRPGVTKPSLYRSFPSKDELAAAYLRDYDRRFWESFEKPEGKSYSDPREHVLAYIRQLSRRAVDGSYRGCGLSNAAVEYPAREHPARQVAEAHKKVFRKRLRELAAAMGARKPDVLGDGLLLLIEGIYSTGQQSENGAAQSAMAVAKMLIDGSVKSA